MGYPRIHGCGFGGSFEAQSERTWAYSLRERTLEGQTIASSQDGCSKLHIKVDIKTLFYTYSQRDMITS